MDKFKDIPGPWFCYSTNDFIYTDKNIISVTIDTKSMTLTYRGCRYEQEEQAKVDRAWWNLVHRPWNVLVYRNKRYFPYVTGGQIKWTKLWLFTW